MRAAFASLWMLGAGLAACSAGGAAGPAAANAAIGVAAAAVSRSQGGCYSACPVGTACNPKTGMCDELPCRGACQPSERCDTNRLIPACVPRVEAMPDLQIKQKEGPPTPITPN